MNRKGIFLTVDALFALVLTFVFIGFIFVHFTFSSQDSLTADAMHETLEHTLLSAHKSTVLATLDSSQYESFLNETLSFCGKLLVYEDTDLTNEVASATKGGCTDTAYPIVGRRSFLVGSNIHLAYMEVWYE
jgi:hypothetical protein